MLICIITFMFMGCTSSWVATVVVSLKSTNVTRPLNRSSDESGVSFSTYVTSVLPNTPKRPSVH